MSEILKDAYLDLLVEECGEILQAIGKIRRFGLEHYWVKEGKPNYVALAHEIGNLMEVVNRLEISPLLIEEGIMLKRERLKTYGPEVWTPEVGDALAEKEYGDGTTRKE